LKAGTLLADADAATVNCHAPPRATRARSDCDGLSFNQNTLRENREALLTPGSSRAEPLAVLHADIAVVYVFAVVHASTRVVAALTTPDTVLIPFARGFTAASFAFAVGKLLGSLAHPLRAGTRGVVLANAIVEFAGGFGLPLCGGARGVRLADTV
jgi:hypothetical protein